MSSLLPVALYGLEVPPGDHMIPAAIDFPATIRITMAALDPTDEPTPDVNGSLPLRPRSTLKLIKTRLGDVDMDDGDDEDDESLRALLGMGSDDDDEDEDEDEDHIDEPNGGPSDPSKSKKARQANALEKLLEATKNSDSDDDMEEVGGKPNGIKNGKGKKASDEDDDEDDDEESDDDEIDVGDLEEFVVCTLDPESHYQQPLDLTVGEGEKVFFIVSGTHTVHLTGNYVIDQSEETDSEDDDEYDLPPDELEDLVGDSDGEYESDELDAIDLVDRIKELEEDEEVAPVLVPSKSTKGKNKRSAEAAADGLDDMIAKEAGAGAVDETKLSKKQLKKLKNNKGQAVDVEETVPVKVKLPAKDKGENGTAKSDKKVQFAKNLEQGPTGSSEKAKPSEAKASTGMKVVQGVTIDDRKIGTGRTVKTGDKVGMRYIGKLQSGKVFDSNKKGTPFSFHLGKGEVIKGWDIGIVGMSVGGERRLTIPANLAYGSKGVPGIPSNSTLTFDVKLLEIK